MKLFNHKEITRIKLDCELTGGNIKLTSGKGKRMMNEYHEKKMSVIVVASLRFKR